MAAVVGAAATPGAGDGAAAAASAPAAHTSQEQLLDAVRLACLALSTSAEDASVAAAVAAGLRPHVLLTALLQAVDKDADAGAKRCGCEVACAVQKRV